ncbi:hypothetical protein [Aliidiomarina sanyensis]|uniref:CSD domain-containing protein n=1 Tax=Aliidiomarina sanyensis TaxID=1249555 RepID=A0A432WKE0_9GAMM|nr:hypothetical protein [Aliidiomarina sanyensis]RUO34263.1 hypothetical protein CWE11_05920 [Aliidiomarina sanyensis]
MRGKILGFNAERDEGAIGGDDGVRYFFKLHDWVSETSPIEQTRVEFEIRGTTALNVRAEGENV